MFSQNVDGRGDAARLGVHPTKEFPSAPPREADAPKFSFESDGDFDAGRPPRSAPDS